MATYYVSNAALNGYTLGIDTNNGTSKVTPFLTIAKAVSVMSTGDICTVNPTSTTTATANNPYVESSGSGYLNIPSGIKLTIQTDPNYPSTYAVIQSTVSSRIINLTGDTNTTMGYFIGLVFDFRNVASQLGITPHTTYNWTVQQCTVVNGATSAFFWYAIGTPGSANANVTLDRIVQHSTYTGSIMDNKQLGTVNVLGGSYLYAGSSISWFYHGVTGGTVGNINFGLASDGTAPSFAGNGVFCTCAGTFGAVIVDSIVANNIQRGLYFSQADATCQTTTPPIIRNCIYTLGTNSTYGIYATPNELVACPEIYDNIITQTSTSSTVDPLAVVNGFGAAFVYNNTVTNNGMDHTVIVGLDGWQSEQTNATPTTQRNLGDVSGNTYVDQFLTTTAQASSHSSYLAAFVANMYKNGSPTGNITCAAYTDNAGVPGTLIETSTTVFPATSLTGSQQGIQFVFSNHTYVAPGTKVHFVLYYTGTINGTDYIKLEENTTVTAGSILYSANGSSWTADTSHALTFTYFTGPYSIVDSKIYGNTLISSNNDDELHMCCMMSTTRGQIYKNLILGGSIGTIFKLCGGTSPSNQALSYDNLFYTNYQSSGGGLYAKASEYVSYYNNVVVQNGISSGGPVKIESDSNAGVANNLLCDHVTFENNIIVNNITTSNTPFYDIVLNGLGQGPTNMTYNGNVLWSTTSQPISSSYATFSLWQAAGNDVNSVYANPLLANETSPSSAASFLPASNSPAKAIGIYQNGLVPSDYIGNPFYLTPDAGAYSISYTANLSKYGYSYKYNVFTSNFDLVSSGNISTLLLSILPQVITVYGNITLPSIADQTITVLANATGGNITVTIPTSIIGTYNVKKIDSSANTVTIVPSSGTIDGGASTIISQQYASISCIGNGTNLDIL